MIVRSLRFVTLAMIVLAAAPADAQRRNSRRSSRSRRAPAAMGPSGSGPGPFAGRWSVASNTEVSVTTPIVRTESRQTRELVVVGPASGADLEMQVTNDRGESCRLLANRRGSSISLAAEQQCFFTDPVQGIAFSFTLQRGSGTVQGQTLNLDLAWTVFANVGMVINGTAAQRSTGTPGAAVSIPAAPGVPAGTPGVPAGTPGVPAGNGWGHRAPLQTR